MNDSLQSIQVIGRSENSDAVRGTAPVTALLSAKLVSDITTKRSGAAMHSLKGKRVDIVVRIKDVDHTL